MAEYIFLMHDDADDEGSWEPYLQTLKENGSFEGGSAIGDGVCMRKRGGAPSVTAHLTGYIRVNANNIEHAKALLAGNPHFEGVARSKYASCHGRVEALTARGVAK